MRQVEPQCRTTPYPLSMSWFAEVCSRVEPCGREGMDQVARQRWAIFPANEIDGDAEKERNRERSKTHERVNEYQKRRVRYAKVGIIVGSENCQSKILPRLPHASNSPCIPLEGASQPCSIVCLATNLPTSNSKHSDQDGETRQVRSQADIVEDLDHAELAAVQRGRLALGNPRQGRAECPLLDQQGKEWEDAQGCHHIEAELAASPGLLGQVGVLARDPESALGMLMDQVAQVHVHVHVHVVPSVPVIS